MKKTVSVILTALLIAVISPTLSQASLITKNWTAYIQNIYGNNTENPTLQIGDEFDITFSYYDLDIGRTVTPANGSSPWVQGGSELIADDVTAFTFSPNLVAAIAESTLTQTYYQTFVSTVYGYPGYQQFVSIAHGYELSVINHSDWNTSLRYNYKGGGEQQVSLKIKSSGDNNPVPEPATMLLFGLGLLGLAGVNRRKK